MYACSTGADSVEISQAHTVCQEIMERMAVSLPGFEISRSKQGWMAIGAAVIIAFVVIARISWPQETKPPAVIVNNYSQNAVACLAHDSGAKPDDSSPTWTAMQEAGTAHLNLQQLAIPGDSPGQAQPYLSGLVAHRCNLIITVGTRLATAVRTVAASAPHTGFLITDAPSENFPPGMSPS
ncbi:hypothetical protein GXW82_44190 [Streptacidiphilus sp. 4-A2]|nr:hypothetical protein [Streptacidiphilus sp. 4-A2]